MIKILYIIFLSLIVTNCSLNQVVDHHGVPFLEKKQTSLIVDKTNKNDIRKILGNPSTKSKFDNDVWIYIERKQTQSELKKLGKMKILKNDVLVLISDGLPECSNSDGEMLDYEAVKTCVNDNGDKSSKDIVNELINIGDSWMGEKSNDDDITIVVIKKR